MKGMEGHKPSKKEQGMSKLRHAVAALAALTAAAEVGVRPESIPYEQAGHSEAREQARNILTYYTTHPGLLTEDALQEVADAMHITSDRHVVLRVFSALGTQANVSGDEERQQMYAFMTSLEEKAQLPAAEILFLHRSPFVYESGLQEDEDFMLLWNRRFLGNGELAHTAYLEPAFRILRTHEELGTLEARAHLALLVSRRIEYVTPHQRPESVNEEIVFEHVRRLEQEYKEFENLPIFNETIVALYAVESADGKDEFYNEAQTERLRSLATTLHEYAPNAMENTSEIQQDQRFRAMFDQVSTATTPVTLFFSAHGGPEGLYLDHENPGTSTELSPTVPVQMIVDAFVRRYTEHPELLEQARTRPDSIVLGNCYAGSVATNIYTALSARGLPVPTIVGSSEEGMLGYGAFKGTRQYPSELLTYLFQVGTPATHRPTLGDLARIDTRPHPFSDGIIDDSLQVGDFVVRPARQVEGGRTERNMQLSENEQNTTASV